MGSIYHIETNPNRWPMFCSSKQLKPELGGDKLVTIRYGSCDDDPDGICGLDMYMREEVYQKLLSGEYKIHPDSRYRHRLIVIDINGNVLPPIKEGFCY